MSVERLPLLQLDAFAARPFEGNPAAVCPLEAWPSDARMQAIAAENALSETAFLVPRAGEDGAWDLRWFTPETEVDLCGHATLAAGWVALERLRPGLERAVFHTRSGALAVERDGAALAMDLPADRLEPCPPPPGLAAALGAAPRETLRGRYLVAVLEDEAAVRALAPDARALRALGEAVVATAPGTSADVVSRFFAPSFGIDEDPVTGSAHATIAPYWAARLGRSRLAAVQASRRGGRLDLELRGERVRITGSVVLVLEGELLLPPEPSTSAAARPTDAG